MPFGPRANPASGEAGVDARERVPDDRGKKPPSASDFWGEESAAIQDALQAPQTVPAVERPDPSQRPPATPPWHRRVSYAVQRRRGTEHEDSASKSRRSYARVLLGAAAALIVIVAAVGSQSGSGVRPNGPGRGEIATDLGGVAAGVGRIAHSKLRIAEAAPQHKQPVRVPRHHASRVSRRGHRSRRGSAGEPFGRHGNPGEHLAVEWSYPLDRLADHVIAGPQLLRFRVGGRVVRRLESSRRAGRPGCPIRPRKARLTPICHSSRTPCNKSAKISARTLLHSAMVWSHLRPTGGRA